jgi:hypothetical protein
VKKDNKYFVVAANKIMLGPSKDEMQLQLMNDERTTARSKGGATLIGHGLKIEESQYGSQYSGINCKLTIFFRVFLATVSRRLGRNPSMKENIDLAERQQRLQLRIDDFQERAAQLWPVDDDEMWLERAVDDPSNILPSDSEEEELFPSSEPITCEGPEKALLLLPSNVGLARCTELGYELFAEQEKALRIGQMNDSLHGLRLAISRKAVIFQEGLRNSRSKNQKTRSWDEITQVDGSVRHHARVYCWAWAAFLRLGADISDVARFQPLTQPQLSVTTAQIDLSLRGQRDSSLAWFWLMDIQADGHAAYGMNECESFELIAWSSRWLRLHNGSLSSTLA